MVEMQIMCRFTKLIEIFATTSKLEYLALQVMLRGFRPFALAENLLCIGLVLTGMRALRLTCWLIDVNGMERMLRTKNVRIVCPGLLLVLVKVIEYVSVPMQSWVGCAVVNAGQTVGHTCSTNPNWSTNQYNMMDTIPNPTTLPS